MFLVFYQYHSNARTRMYGQDALSLDGEYASVAAEADDVRKTLRTS